MKPRGNQHMHKEFAMEPYLRLLSQCIQWTARQALLAGAPTISMPCSLL